MSESSEQSIVVASNKRKPLPPVEFLRECFEYFPDTGKLVWKERPRGHFKSEWNHISWNRTWAGKVVGSKEVFRNKEATKKHRLTTQVMPYGVFGIHRLIFALSGLEDPEDIDHINGDPWDNRLCNLRAATHSQNMMNQRLTRVRKRDFPRGVHFQSNRYRAIIRVNKKLIFLGGFPTLELAVEARRKAEEEHFGEFAFNKSREGSS